MIFWWKSAVTLSKNKGVLEEKIRKGKRSRTEIQGPGGALGSYNFYLCFGFRNTDKLCNKYSKMSTIQMGLKLEIFPGSLNFSSPD